jgi:hypothetical protein
VTFDCLFTQCEAPGMGNLPIDHLGPWWTGSFMENPTYIGMSLSDVRVIMTIMRILVE